MKNKLGKIHIYLGDGKGKTTAALGLAMRARGAGLKVIVLQFLKKGNYSELKSLQKLGVKVEQLGQRSFCNPQKVKKDERKKAKKGLMLASDIVFSKKYDLVILDEINVAIKFCLIQEEELIDLLKLKPKNVELVLTGRGLPKQLIKMADYVTEMKLIKHPFKDGLKSRIGIEE